MNMKIILFHSYIRFEGVQTNVHPISTVANPLDILLKITIELF